MCKILIGVWLLLLPLSVRAGGPEHWPGAYEVYAPGKLADTPPPRGFSACYVSHYGRHGSRYLLSEDEFACLAQWDSLAVRGGGLTAEGAALREGLEHIRTEHARMFGILTGKGSGQHRGIGERLARRFPSAFRKKAPLVRCISSPAQRCLQSMANFTLGLCRVAPACSFDLRTGQRYYDIISTRMDDSAWRATAQHREDSVLRTELLPLVDAGRFFRNPEGLSGAEESLLQALSGIYTIGCAATGLDSPYEDWLPRFFSAEQLAVFRHAEEVYDARLFLHPDNPRIHKTAVPLLRDFLTRADEALRAGNIAADLRFGHDSGLLPLIALTGLSANGQFCMAENLQLVFYKNKTGEVLVKFLFNEEESALPALQPETGCYYTWPAVRQYFENLCTR